MGIRSLAAEFLPSALQGLQRAVSSPTVKSPQVASFATLTERLSYLSKADHKKVLEAYKFADEAHLGQFRMTGEPYITHPIAVAGLCADWKLDVQAIMAALMHDTIEDQGVTKAALIERFGAPTAELVGRPDQAGQAAVQHARGRPGRDPSARCCWRWRATCASSSSSWPIGCTTCARMQAMRPTSASASHAKRSTSTRPSHIGWA